MQLRIQHTDGREEFVKLDKAKPIRIGSDPSADVVVEGRGVLAVHVGVAFRDGSFVAMASKAAQTIDVNGQPVNQAPLEEGDRVKLGSVSVTAVSDSAGKASSFEDEFGLAPSDDAPKSAPAKAPAPKAPAPVDEEFGLALDDDDHGKKPAAKEKPAEKPAAPKLRSAEEKVHKVAAGPMPVDDEFGLAPMEDEGHGKPAAKTPAKTPAKPAGKPAAKAPAEDDDFGLSPVEDEKPAAKPASKPAAPAAKAKPPVEDDDGGLGEIGLSPMEDEGHGKPAKPGKGAKAPGKPAAGKPAAGKAAAKPEPAKAPAGKGKPADAKKGKPADDDSGLEPIGDDGLEPLGDDGLEPLGDDGGLEPLGDAGGLDDALGPAKQLPAKGGKGAAAKAPAKAPAKGRKGKSGPGFGAKVAAAMATPGARKAGLGLGVLAAIGLVAFVVSNLPTADGAFQTADQEFQAKQYPQASESFQKFLAAYPGDPRVGEARAKKGLAQLIQTLDASTDAPAALAAAEQALAALGPDARHESARATLATGLPKIAQSLAERASTAFSRKQDTAPAMFEEAQRALALVQRHVSSADRREQGVPAVEVKMFRLERDLQLAQSLSKAVAEIKAAAEGKKLTEAYALRTKLLADYPRLASHGDLDQAMRQVADAATAAVEQKILNKAPVGADAPGPLALSLATSTVVGGTMTVPAGAPPAVVAAPGEGTVYGVDLAKGTVLWRRFVGFSPQVAPVAFGDGAAARVLLVDTARGELLAVEPATGKLAWRNMVEGIVAAPAVGKTHAYVPTARGAVVLVDLKSGSLVGETILPQPITSPPAIEESTGRVYQLGDHSNLYVLSAEGKCEAAFATGHEPGTVHLAPILLASVVILAVDEDLDSTTLRVFQRGREFKPLQSVKLAGHISRPPLAADKLLYLSSDTGQVLRCEFDATKADQPLVVLSPVPGLPMGSPPEIAVVGRELWVAGAGLSIYSLPISDAAPKRFFSRDRLVDAPRSLVAGKPGPMVLVRRVADWPGLAVSLAASAEDLAEPKPEIRLAAIAGPPRAEGKGEKLALVHPAGIVEEIPASVLSAAAPPLLGAQSAASAPRALAGDTIPWDDGHAVFVPAAGFRTILVQDLASAKTRRIDLPGPVSSMPVRSGDMLLVAVEGGPLFLVDPAKGPVGQPFWPKLAAGQFPRWRGPAETAPGQFVISDGHLKIYKVAVDKDKLTIAAEGPLESPLVSPLAAAGSVVWGADARGQLVAFGEDLKPAGAVPLESPVAWGPARVGDLVLVSTRAERLMALGGDPAPKWQVDLPHGAVAGAAAPGAGQILFTSSSGVVWGVKADSGENLSSVETGVPLSGAPVVAADKVLVTGREGSVHVLSASPASLFKPKAAENAAASN